MMDKALHNQTREGTASYALFTNSFSYMVSKVMIQQLKNGILDFLYPTRGSIYCKDKMHLCYPKRKGGDKLSEE
jgi:hypothetical protein